MSKDIRKLWEYTFAPDESICHCILYNSEYRDSLVGKNLCYMEWNGQTSPKTFTINDYYKMKDSGQFFARKVHPKISKELIDKIFSEI